MDCSVILFGTIDWSPSTLVPLRQPFELIYRGDTHMNVRCPTNQMFMAHLIGFPKLNTLRC
jgi:hypothetical protein